MQYSFTQTQPLTPTGGLDMHYSPTYKSPPPGGGAHVTQATNHGLVHSTNQQTGTLEVLVPQSVWWPRERDKILRDNFAWC